MQRIVVDIPDTEYGFFMRLMESLSFAKVSAGTNLTSEQKIFVEGTMNSLEQVEQFLRGEIKLKTAEELIVEL
jgi:hypothetical protein